MTTIPTYVFEETAFTVGDAPVQTDDTGTEGQVTLTETVYLNSDVPPGMKILNAAAFIQDFNLSFAGGDHHQVDRFKLWSAAKVKGNGNVELSVDIILNNNSDHFISSDSTVSVLTMIQLVPSDDSTFYWNQSSSAIGFCDRTTSTGDDEDQPENLTFTGMCNGTPISESAVVGWDLTSKNGNTHKFTSFDFNAGTAVYDGSRKWQIYIQDAYVQANNSGGHDFDSEGLFYAIAADDPATSGNPVGIAVQTSEYRADGQVDTLTFGADVKYAYAVVKNIINKGDNGATNSLSAFTCSGVSVTVPSVGLKNTVEVDWKRQRSVWKGAAAASWDSVVDYMIIAVLED